MTTAVINNYINLFRGRGDAYGTWEGGTAEQGPKGARTRIPLTRDIMARHLTSNDPADWIGVYTHLGASGDQHCTWGCVDIDGKDFPLTHPCDNCSEYDEHTCHLDGEEYGPYEDGWDWDTMWDLARTLQTVLNVKDVYAHLERTKNGIHVWVFPQGGHCLARTMRRALMAACTAVGYAPKEVNPKQEELAPGKIGNYVRLPYYGALAAGRDPLLATDRYFVSDDNELLVITDFLDTVTLTSVEALEAVAALWTPPARVTFDGPPPEDVENILPLLPGKAYTIWKDGPLEGRDRSNTLAKLAYELEQAGIQQPAAFSVVKDADRRWGKFFDRPDCDEQIMRFVERAYSN